MDHGYGICYNPIEDKIIYTVCSYGSCSDTDSTVLGEAIIESLRQMRNMLLSTMGNEE